MAAMFWAMAWATAWHHNVPITVTYDNQEAAAAAILDHILHKLPTNLLQCQHKRFYPRLPQSSTINGILGSRRTKCADALLERNSRSSINHNYYNATAPRPLFFSAHNFYKN